MKKQLFLASCLLAAACGGSGGSANYDVTVTRTALGIPHIRATREGDFGSLGYGDGYAQAEDNLCLLMEDLVTIAGERAKYFGDAGSYAIYANSSSANNVDSDFFWRSNATPERLAALKKDMLPEALAGTIGFKDGFNRYVRELKDGGFAGRHQDCRAAPWLREITLDDMLRRYFRLGVLASSSVFAGNIGSAQPPASGSVAVKPALRGQRQVLAALRRGSSALDFYREPPIGSNMYAIGKDMSASGVPIVFGNPHFPWRGTERLYLAHLTVPGRADIMGAALYGVPLALIGFNDHFAWSHTVSTAYRFTFYELTLDPSDPTSYIYDGQTYKMEAVPMTIDVRNDDGTLRQVTRTLYRSKFGPMTTLNVTQQGRTVNIFPWTAEKAYTMRDANAENTRLINHFLRWNTARSLQEFKQIQRETVAVPWVNTVASGPGGKAYYADITNVPNVPDAKAQQCITSAQGLAVNQLMPGVYVLDGSTSRCEWDTDADAPAPGIFGPSHLPSLERDDWVGNNNDSHWVTNPAQPITGYAKIIGPEATARSLRTRHSILKQLHRAAGDDGYPGKQWTPEILEQSVLDSHIYSADLALDDVLASPMCQGGFAMTTTGPVDVSAACAALAAWDRSNNLDSQGGQVWREFWRSAQAAQGFYLVPFSASDPVNTPNTINIASPQVQQAMADAVNRLAAANIAPDARMGSIQHAWFDPSIEIFGGLGNTDGAFTIAQSSLTKDQGYPVTFGNSYIQVVTWEPEGEGWKPIADAFVTYSQSTDPASPNFNNFTREYSRKAWKRLPFRADEIARDKVSEIHLTN